MLELRDWARTHPLPPRPWLVLGKGPSFGWVHEVDLEQYNVVALNHVVRELKVHVTHFADLEALEHCADSVLTNTDWVLMPYRPHIQFRVTDQSLADLARSVPVLAELERRKRLVWYNLSTGAPVGDSPVIQVDHFGSEAVVAILAALGVKVIRTLGVDGGRLYDRTFKDLAGKTLLSSGAISYDLQFVGIRRTVDEYGIDFAALTPPLRVFVGTDESQNVPARVLEYTIRKHASRPVDFVHLDTVDVPLPRDAVNQPRTGFSFKRFAIPALCGYRGRALYLDADMIVFDDIARLWDIPFNSRAVLCTSQPEAPQAWRDYESFKPGRQMSVMLLDCSRLPWDPAAIIRGLDEGRYTYGQLMFDLCVVDEERIAETLPPEWNSLERYDTATTKLLHYTVVPTQPWKSDDNPLGHLWTAQYAEAVSAGAVPIDEVEDGIAKGFLKPALAACLHLAPRPGSPGTIGLPAESHRVQRLELEARAARGELLIAQAQLNDVYQSWTWRVGHLATQPARFAVRVLRRVARPVATLWARPRRTASADALPALYRAMHEKKLFPGTTWQSVFDAFVAAIPDVEQRTILDFGCGPRGGLAERLAPGRVVSYDPYVDAYAASPWGRDVDVVFSSDVLEHLPQEDIEGFASQVLRCRPEFVFLNISTRPADKTFPNGANVHVTVKPANWWRATLGEFWDRDYTCRMLQEKEDECTLLFRRRHGHTSEHAAPSY